MQARSEVARPNLNSGQRSITSRIWSKQKGSITISSKPRFNYVGVDLWYKLTKVLLCQQLKVISDERESVCVFGLICGPIRGPTLTEYEKQSKCIMNYDDDWAPKVGQEGTFLQVFLGAFMLAPLFLFWQLFEIPILWRGQNLFLFLFLFYCRKHVIFLASALNEHIL